jgi:hypothetical protein
MSGHERPGHGTGFKLMTLAAVLRINHRRERIEAGKSEEVIHRNR